MALTNTPKRIIAVKNITSYHTGVLTGGEKASQTYVKGAALQDDDAGRITESTSPVDGSAVGKRCLGFAQAAASGTTDKDVMIDYAGDGALFEATLSDTTAGTHTLVLADKFQTYPITKDGVSGIWYLDANAVSADGGFIVSFKDPVGTVDARVIFKVTPKCVGPVHAASGPVS